MNLRVLHMLLDASNLGLQGLDAGHQLFDRQRIEILLGELCQRISRLAGEQVVQVHGRIVDP